MQPELAAELKSHVATKSPAAPVFDLPHESSMARVLRSDLAEARKLWLADATSDPQLYANRERSDFWDSADQGGGLLDFHSLRHTCGAWLALARVHPKTVQVIMRHSSITLTMDTYGHLFPGQEVDAVAQMQTLLADPVTQPEVLRATGTDGQRVDGQRTAQRHAQHAKRDDRLRRGANWKRPARSQRKRLSQQLLPT
jgi:hypothetical protein